jgi:hypothetical protein
VAQDRADRPDGAEREGMPRVDRLEDLLAYVGEGTYLRFSRGPGADRGTVSRDYEAELDLPGLSAETLTPEPWWDRPVEDWIARQVCKYLHIREQADDDRYAWVLRGEVVARGPDREPILTDIEPLAWLSEAALEEAQGIYERRFDVGNDSTDA